MASPQSQSPGKKVLRKLWEESDGNIAEVADRLGRSPATVATWCRHAGLKGLGMGGKESTCPDNIEELYERFGGVYQRIATHLQLDPSTIAKWCKKRGLGAMGHKQYQAIYPQQIDEELTDGFVVCFSDAHFWFEEKSRAHEALLIALKKLKPAIVVANGDILDGATISRHDPSGIDPLPTLDDELEVSKRHMAEIARAARPAKLYFTIGNHDSRLSRFRAKNAAPLEGLDGSNLDHHFIGWTFCMSMTINRDLVIKHAFRGGIHATWNNTLHDGRTIVTGHLHAQMVRPFTDAHGTRYGVDLGCLADPSWPQFNYTTANIKNWRSGFGVIEFRDGRMLPPMLASVLDDGTVYLQRNERLL